MTDTKRDTAASPNGSALSDLLGLAVMKPAAWEWHDINGDQQVNWHCKPPNASGALYRRAAIDRVLAHSREVHQFNAELHAKNTALSCEVLDLRQALGDLLTAHAMRASCQAGLVDRCKCVGCATTRARVALGA